MGKKTILLILLLLPSWSAANPVAESDPLGKAGDSTRSDSKSRKPRIHGYMQIHYRQAYATGADPVVDNDDFRVQRARVGIEGNLHPWLSYDLEVDPRAPEVTGILRDAYVTFKLPLHQRLRIGQQKQPFGYENMESSSRLYVVNRAEVSDNLSRGINLRDIGLGLMGHAKLTKALRLENAFSVSNGAGMNVQADDTRAKNSWGRLGIRYKRGDGGFESRLGVSGGAGDLVDLGEPASSADDTTLTFKRLGFDVTADQAWFFLAGEYVMGWDEVEATGETDEPFGYYALLAVKTPWQAGPMARFDALGDEYRRMTLGAFYGLPKAILRVLLNYEIRLLKDDVRADDKFYSWLQVRF